METTSSGEEKFAQIANAWWECRRALFASTASRTVKVAPGVRVLSDEATMLLDDVTSMDKLATLIYSLSENSEEALYFIENFDIECAGWVHPGNYLGLSTCVTHGKFSEDTEVQKKWRELLAKAHKVDWAELCQREMDDLLKHWPGAPESERRRVRLINSGREN